MICPKCLAEILDDSCFCDQCGAKLYICPSCGKISVFQFCENDNAETKELNCGEGEINKSFFKTVRADKSIDNHSLKLINQSKNLFLELEDGDVIGRKVDKFKDQMESLKQISSKHISANYNNLSGWTVMDLSSTNGTKLNGIKLEPNKPVKISSGDSLVLANVEFYVKLEK